MSADQETTRLVRSWLEQGATALPDRVLDAVRDQLPATHQRRSSWSARRFEPMNNYARLAIAAVAVVVVAIGGFALLQPGGSSGTGGTPAADPSSTPSPSAAASRSAAASTSQIGTADWVPFTSDRYSYTVSYPRRHTGIPPSKEGAPTHVAQAKRDFIFGKDQFNAEEPGPGQSGNTPVDVIVLGPEGYQIAWFGFAVTVPAGTSVDDIISQSVGTKTVPCESESITIDGQPGRFDVCGEGHSIAVVIVGDRAYVFIQGRGSVEKDLMLATLSTVQLPTP